MKIVSFNVNSVRQRLPQLRRLVDKHAPDIIGLQETKVTDADFPVADIEALGYRVEFFGQKTHYGVALLSKLPFKSVQKGFAGDAPDAQRRFIAGTFVLEDGSELVVMNGYFPQGENREHAIKFPAKRRFYADLNELLKSSYSPEQKLVVMGDMNVSHQDIDIGIGEDNRKRWLRSGKCSFLPEERQWLDELLDWGLIDTYRQRHQGVDESGYSWFDYRSRGFEREPKRGLRIDLILATEALAACCVAAGIDYEIRGMEKPSDHAPIWSEFNL